MAVVVARTRGSRSWLVLVTALVRVRLAIVFMFSVLFVVMISVPFHFFAIPSMIFH